MAIAAMRENRVVLPDSHEYFGILTKNVYFKITEKDEASFSITVNWGDKLLIMVRSLKDSVSDCKMLINIKPNVVDWNLDISSVELWIYSEEAGAFTVAWKAFEHELIINSIKAEKRAPLGQFTVQGALFVKRCVGQSRPARRRAQKTTQIFLSLRNILKFRRGWLSRLL